MPTSELAAKLSDVFWLFGQAFQALLADDVATFQKKYVEALRALDAFQDYKSSASV